jgi:hypothetical protein
MPSRIKPQQYRYRQHLMVLDGDHWNITGPSFNGTARTIVLGIQAIDQAPGVPPKMTKKEAGKLGAAVTWSRYSLRPYGTSDFAMVRRDTGEIVAYQSGRRV